HLQTENRHRRVVLDRRIHRQVHRERSVVRGDAGSTRKVQMIRRVDLDAPDGNRWNRSDRSDRSMTGAGTLSEGPLTKGLSAETKHWSIVWHEAHSIVGTAVNPVKLRSPH